MNDDPQPDPFTELTNLTGDLDRIRADLFIITERLTAVRNELDTVPVSALDERRGGHSGP